MQKQICANKENEHAVHHLNKIKWQNNEIERRDFPLYFLFYFFPLHRILLTAVPHTHTYAHTYVYIHCMLYMCGAYSTLISNLQCLRLCSIEMRTRLPCL